MKPHVGKREKALDFIYAMDYLPTKMLYKEKIKVYRILKSIYYLSDKS